jgi:hypothetical protein
MMASQEAHCHFLVFFLGVEDDDELSRFVVLLHLKKKKVKKKQRKKKVDVYLLTTYALVIFWKNIFYNTTSAMSFAALFQHHFCNIVSTSPLQHCFL